jgi:hypothetical protein
MEPEVGFHGHNRPGTLQHVSFTYQGFKHMPDDADAFRGAEHITAPNAKIRQA